MKIVVGAIALATALGAADAFPCSESDSWDHLEGGSSKYPANAAVLFHDMPGAISAMVDEEPAQTVPAGFPALQSLFVDPLPWPGQRVKLEGSYPECPGCTNDSMSFTVGEPDVTPPELSGPFFYDLHTHPRTFSECGPEGGELTYIVRIDTAEGQSPEIALVDAYADATRSELLFSRHPQIVPGRPLELELDHDDLGDVPPEQVCLAVRLTDAAGNALEEVMLCGPCHHLITSSNQEPDWANAPVSPAGVCSTEMPEPERLAGLAPLPERGSEPAGCNTSGRGASFEWALLLLALLVKRRDGERSTRGAPARTTRR